MPGEKNGQSKLEVNAEKAPGSHVQLDIIVPFSEVAEDLADARRRIAKEIQVPGFRKGKTPLDMVDKFVGKDKVFEQVYDNVIRRFVQEAIKLAEVEAITYPECQVVSFDDGEPLVLRALVPVHPEVVVGDYGKIAVTAPALTVREEDIEEVFTDLLRSKAELVVKDGPVAEGDVVYLDTELVCNGKVKKGAGRKDVPLAIKPDSPEGQIAQFLIGAKVGETRTFNEESEPGSEQDLAYELKVNEIKEYKLPKANKKFFASLEGDYAGCADQAELKERIRAHLADERAATVKAFTEQEVLRQVLAKTVIELPEGLVQTNVNFRLNGIEAQLSQHDMTLEKHLEATGQDRQAFQKELVDQTSYDLRIDYLLDAVAKKENLKATKKEIAAAARKDESLVGDTLLNVAKSDAELLADLDRNYKGLTNDIRRQIAQEKALAFLVKKAKITTK